MTIDAERYARLHAILEAALAQEPGGWEDAVREACGDDQPLLAEALALLAAASASASDDDLAIDGPGAVPADPFSERAVAASRAAMERLADQASRDADAADAWQPERIAGYAIVRRIGEGGMGVVYEAMQAAPRRRVAIKLLHPMHVSADRMRRFRREAELLGRLRHPGIAQIFEAGTYDLGRGAQPFFAMEFIDGPDLRTHAARAGLDRRARLDLLARVCDAVQHAHEQGIVHRDLKPENILVDEQGQPRVLDFGVSQVREASSTASTIVTRTGQIVGTLAYMAPEQLARADGPISPRLDVHALGVVGFELLTGRLPHAVEDLPLSMAVTVLATSEAPRAGSIDARLRGDVETILGTALDSDSSRRYATAGALGADIRRHLDRKPITARPPTRRYLAGKFVARHRTLVAGVAATFVVLLAGIVVALALAAAERTQRQRADDEALVARANQARAVGALLLSAEALRTTGDRGGARRQHGRVPESDRDWAWRFLDRSLPRWIDTLVGAAPEGPRLLDEETIGQVDVANGRLELVDVETGERRSLPLDGVTRVAPAIDDGRLRGRSPEEVMLLDPVDGRITARWPAWRVVNPVSQDGRTTLRRVEGGPAEIRRDDGPPIRIEPREPDELFDLSFDGRAVVGAGRRGSRLIDLASGRLVTETGPDGRISLGDRAAIAWEAAGNRWYEWTADDASPITEGPGPPRSPFDYRRLDRRISIEANSGHGRGTVRAVPSGEPIVAPPFIDDRGLIRYGHDRWGTIEPSPGGTRLLLSSIHAGTEVMDLPTRPEAADGDARSVVMRGHDTWIYHLAVSPDGTLVASAAAQDRFIRVWDARAGRELARIERRVHPSRSWDAFMAFTEDGDTLILTTPFDEHAMAIVAWDLAAGTVVVEPQPAEGGHVNHVPALDAFIARLEPGPRTRLSQRAHMMGDEAVIAWALAQPNQPISPTARTDRGDRWRPMFDPQVDIAGGTGIAVHPAEDRVAIVSRRRANDDPRFGQVDSGLLTILRGDGTIQHRVEFDRLPWCVAWSPDGTLLAVGTNDGGISLYETTFMTLRLKWIGHAAGYRYVHSLAWMPDGHRLVTVSGDETVRVWDDRRPRVVARDAARWSAAVDAAATLPVDELRRRHAAAQGRERAALRVALIGRSPQAVGGPSVD